MALLLNLCDDYNHVIEKGMKYLKSNYLEKKLEKGNIFYEKLKKTVYVLPAQVLNALYIEG